MTLGILLPTRGRPDNLERFLTAVVGTAEDWYLFVRLDYDDPTLDEYLDVMDVHAPTGRFTSTIGPRVRFGPSLNELADAADLAGMSHVGMFGDDVVPETPGWDVALVEALGDNLGVAYGDDGLRDKHSPDLPTHYVTNTEVYRRLGYLSPPGIQHLFLDNVARDIGRVLGNFPFVPVDIRHRHPWADGEHLNDMTYAEGGRNSAIRKADRKEYLRWASDRTWKKRLR